MTDPKEATQQASPASSPVIGRPSTSTSLYSDGGDNGGMDAQLQLEDASVEALLQRMDAPTYAANTRVEILEFPPDCKMNDAAKQAWLVEARGFGHEICLRPGRNGCMVGSYTTATTTKLTTAGFRNIVLRRPCPKTTKVIIKGLAHRFDLGIIAPELPKLRGAAWNKMSRSGKEIVGYWEGPFPDTVLSKTLGLVLHVEKYQQKPTLCGKCSRWTHST